MPPTFIIHPNADSIEREFIDLWRNLDGLVSRPAPTAPAAVTGQTTPASQEAGQVVHWIQLISLDPIVASQRATRYPIADFTAGSIQVLNVGLNILVNDRHVFGRDTMELVTSRTLVTPLLKGPTFDPQRDIAAHPKRLWYARSDAVDAVGQAALLPKARGYYPTLPLNQPADAATLAGVHEAPATIAMTFSTGVARTQLFLDHLIDLSNDSARTLKMQVFGTFVIFGRRSMTLTPAAAR